MPTNRLGAGTTNVPVNWLDEERSVIGRLASAHDLSRGAFIRKLCIERLTQTHPAQASELLAARSTRRLTRLRIVIN